MSIEQKLMTADELLNLPRGRARHELVRGELRIAPLATIAEARLAMEIGGSLHRHAEANALGTVVTGAGFLIAVDPDTVRAPDVAFVRRERLSSVELEEGYFPGPPDLVVEIVARDDLYLDVMDKVAEWLEHGTQLVFVVDPKSRTVAIHRPGPWFRRLGLSGVLDGEDVVPGWRLTVRDLFGLR